MKQYFVIWLVWVVFFIEKLVNLRVAACVSLCYCVFWYPTTMSCPKLSNLHAEALIGLGSSILKTQKCFSVTLCCVPFRPPSTAMILGIPQAEAERLLEDRKGGNVHISHSLTGMYLQTLRLKRVFLFPTIAIFEFSPVLDKSKVPRLFRRQK